MPSPKRERKFTPEQASEIRTWWRKEIAHYENVLGALEHYRDTMRDDGDFDLVVVIQPKGGALASIDVRPKDMDLSETITVLTSDHFLEVPRVDGTKAERVYDLLVSLVEYELRELRGAIKLLDEDQNDDEA